MKKSLSFFCLMSIYLGVTFGQSEPFATGGGEYSLESTADNCLSATDRAAIQDRLRINANQLIAEGKLTVSGDRTEVAFAWPLQKSADFTWNSYWGISAHVDQDATAGILDYNCTDRTYNGHKGTDFFTWPFPWYMYENDFVEVIAGAPGVIIGKDNGYEDDHCECIGYWNAIYIQHEDGSVAWYGHMKNGSLTDKTIGETVAEGEFLGIVASSGCSTGPHLHLEVYDAESNLIDPYAGDCNSFNEDSWWQSQDAFRVPTINTILTHDVIPEHGCPNVNEDPHLSNDFFPGEEVITAVYFHDALAGTVGNYRLLMPDGSLWNTWGNTMDVTYNASWWYWTWYLPETGPFGVWTFEADYQGETVVHQFNYGVYANLAETELSSNPVLFPNPVTDGLIYSSDFAQNGVAEVFDSAGKKVKDIVLTVGGADVSGLAPGVYYIHFLTHNGMEISKIMIGG